MMRVSWVWWYTLLAVVATGIVAFADGEGSVPGASRADRIEGATSATLASRASSTLTLDGKSQRRAGAPAVTSPAGVQTNIEDVGPMTGGAIAASICYQPAGHCQAGDRTIALTSDRTKYFVADDFIPAGNESVSEVCWKGGYWNYETDQDCVLIAAGNRFRIRYLADNGGVPGAVLAVFEQVANPQTLTVVGPIPTGYKIAGKPDEYEYRATHDPVAMQAGQCYWIEITNKLVLTDPQAACVWMWEGAVPGDEWAMQEDDGDGAYGTDDAVPNDLTFCLDVPLDEPGACVPPPPPNDDCDNARSISGQGTFAFDNTTARTDGLAHDACIEWGEDEMHADVWYCWLSSCAGTTLVSTCNETDVDTRIVVYRGCDVCPPTDGEVLACNDDRCGEMVDPRQSMVVFEAQPFESYMIRVGVYPGERRGVGAFTVTCGPPDLAACPGDGDCCEDTQMPACGDETCCEMVCACDPFCCDTLWDENCATTGWWGSTCGAAILCPDLCQGCGNPDAGDCCQGHSTGACSDPTCCRTVCDADSFCCEVEWDADCATDGYNHNGNGAAVLCPDLCGAPTCPPAQFAWVDPPNGTVDARQPHPPGDAAVRQGINTIKLTGPINPDASRDCWSLCETGNAGLGANGIVNLTVDGTGHYTLTLARPITPGAVTRVTYTDDAGGKTTGTFTFHPANVNGDSQSSPSDILRVIDYINGVGTSPWGLYSEDIDHSGLLGPPDILRVIDLLNGAGAFDPWLNVARPTADGCP